MQLIQNILSFNQILTVSLLGWLVAQVLKTIINFILLGKFQLERMWGDLSGGYGCSGQHGH